MTSRSRLLPIGAVLALMLLALPATAQQIPQPQPPGGITNPADDRLLIQELQGKLEGQVSIPNQSAGLLQQPQGRDFRQVRNGPVYYATAALILGTTVLLTAFFLYRGRIHTQEGRSGRTVVRFAFFERFVHWMTSTAFLILALTGLNLVFGRHLVLPLIGPDAFYQLTLFGKWSHHVLSYPFVIGIVLMFLIWVRDNIPNRGDIAWLRQGGGFFVRTGAHIQARRFNAGQKFIFWSVVLLGAAIAATGYVLQFPLALTDVNGMQVAQVIHAALGALLIAVIIGHIYIGTLGMAGAFSAMGSGRVDVNWAKEHHSLWLEEENAKSGAAASAPAIGQAAE